MSQDFDFLSLLLTWCTALLSVRCVCTDVHQFPYPRIPLPGQGVSAALPDVSACDFGVVSFRAASTMLFHTCPLFQPLVVATGQQHWKPGPATVQAEMPVLGWLLSVLRHVFLKSPLFFRSCSFPTKILQSYPNSPHEKH